jgi:hypothetical protein
MKDRSDTLTFELLTAESDVLISGPDAPFGRIAGDITQMSVANLAAGAANARKYVALPPLQPARYQPVRLRRRGRQS